MLANCLQRSRLSNQLIITLHELYFYLALIKIDDRKECYILLIMLITDLQLFFHKSLRIKAI